MPNAIAVQRLELELEYGRVIREILDVCYPVELEHWQAEPNSEQQRADVMRKMMAGLTEMLQQQLAIARAEPDSPLIRMPQVSMN